MMSKNPDWGKYFWMRSRKPAKKFAGTRSFGRFTKSRFADFALCHFRIGCFIENCLIAFKLLRSFISAAIREVGEIA